MTIVILQYIAQVSTLPDSLRFDNHLKNIPRGVQSTTSRHEVVHIDVVVVVVVVIVIVVIVVVVIVVVGRDVHLKEN